MNKRVTAALVLAFTGLTSAAALAACPGYGCVYTPASSAYAVAQPGYPPPAYATAYGYPQQGYAQQGYAQQGYPPQAYAAQPRGYGDPCNVCAPPPQDPCNTCVAPQPVEQAAAPAMSEAFFYGSGGVGVTGPQDDAVE